MLNKSKLFKYQESDDRMKKKKEMKNRMKTHVPNNNNSSNNNTSTNQRESKGKKTAHDKCLLKVFDAKKFARRI